MPTADERPITQPMVNLHYVHTTQTHDDDIYRANQLIKYFIQCLRLLAITISKTQFWITQYILIMMLLSPWHCFYL